MSAGRESSLQIQPTPSGYRLQATQWLPRRRDEVFAFFADAFELERLTPPWLNFAVTTPAPIVLQPGSLIDYRLRLRGLPLRWRSRIPVWEPPTRFVDEQLRGPYRVWRHEHRFEDADGGTLCFDTVDYALYAGWLVRLLRLDRLLVERDLRQIFAYRQAQLRQRFG